MKYYEYVIQYTARVMKKFVHNKMMHKYYSPIGVFIILAEKNKVINNLMIKVKYI